MKRMIRIVALMAALMAVTSCQAPDSGSQLAGETVDVSFMGPSARTITTEDGLVQTVATSDLWFQYKAEWQGGGDIPSTATTGWTNLAGPGLTGTVKLHRGTWNLSLRAFVNKSEVGEDGKCILSGSLPGVEIGTKNGTNVVTQTVSVSLGYVRQEGNGTLHVSATYPVVYHEAANPQDSPVEAVRKIKVTANVADTDYTGDITEFNGDNVGTLDLQVPAGAAHVTVQYYMDDSTLFEGDQASKDVLIMATMTTNLAVSVDRDITAVTFEVEQPSGTVEDNVLPKAASLFDIYPGTIADNEIVIGYAEQTKALGDQTPITYPYTILTSASPDSQGRYNATDLGLVPITVTTSADLIASGATSAWWGKTAVGGDLGLRNTNTTLSSVRFVDDVTEIGMGAFALCTALTDVIIPNTVTSIGVGGFIGCSALPNVLIPEGVTSIGPQTFFGCTSLTSVTIPKGVTEIGQNAFDACSALTSISIPDGATTIGDGAFEGCTGLTNVTIPNSITYMGEKAFNGCTSLSGVTIPNGITEIPNGLFEGCTSLTSITIPANVTSINTSAFACCSDLVEINVEEGNNSYAAMEGVLLSKDLHTLVICPAGKTGNFSISNSITAIGDSAFYQCSKLTGITIPDSVKSIAQIAFRGCSGLTDITVPSSVTSIGYRAFQDCTGLISVTLPEGITKITQNMFQHCTELTSITIPNGVTEIEDSAFEDCTSLIDVTIPNGVTTIGKFAFTGCSALPNIILPNSVTLIGFRTFYGCNSLTDIYINTSPNGLFGNNNTPTGCTIHWNSTGPEESV